MSGDDRFWQQILDDHRPRPRELRRLDHELSGTRPSELSGATIEAMVSAGVAPSNPTQRWATRLASAGLLAVSLAGVAAVSLSLVWPSNEPTPRKTSYSEALADAAERDLAPETEDASRQRLHDLGIVDEQVVLTLRVLRDIRARADDPLHALVARETNALRVHFDGSAVPETTGDSSVEAQIAIRQTLGDRTAPPSERERALERASASLRAGIATMRDAKFLFEEHTGAHAEMLSRIRDLLPMGSLN